MFNVVTKFTTKSIYLKVILWNNALDFLKFYTVVYELFGSIYVTNLIFRNLLVNELSAFRSPMEKSSTGQQSFMHGLRMPIFMFI